MGFEQKELRGSLFKNKRKTTEKHPDYTGSAKVDGVEYFMDAWIEEGAQGKWMSVKLKPKTERIGRDGRRSDLAQDQDGCPF